MNHSNPFAKTPLVSNDLNADARRMIDDDLWAGLDLAYPPLRPVRKALAHGNEAGARQALVDHFRSRREPRITKYRTNPHSHWENGPTLLQRADLLAAFKVVEEGVRCDGNAISAPASHMTWHKRPGRCATIN